MKGVIFMTRKTMTIGLKSITALLAMLILFFFFVDLPSIGQAIAKQNTEYAWAYWPWLIGAWVFMLPILTAFIPAWQIFDTIREKGKAFCHENAGRFRLMGHCAMAAGIIFLCLMLIMTFQRASSAPLLIVVTPLVLLFFLALSFICRVFSHLVEEAAELKEENELTI